MSKLFGNILFTTLICFNALAFSQSGDTKREKIEALRTDFISKKLSLSNSESLLFWPLYNELNDKLDASRKTFRLKYNAKTNYDFSTDIEAETYLSAEQFLKQKELDLTKEYYEKFKKIMPVKKVVTLRRAEEDFKKEILSALKNN